MVLRLVLGTALDDGSIVVGVGQESQQGGAHPLRLGVRDDVQFAKVADVGYVGGDGHLREVDEHEEVPVEQGDERGAMGDGVRGGLLGQDEGVAAKVGLVGSAQGGRDGGLDLRSVGLNAVSDGGGELGLLDDAALLELDNGKGLEGWVLGIGPAVVGDVAADPVCGGLGLAPHERTGVGTEDLVDGVEQILGGRANDIAFAVVVGGWLVEVDQLAVQCVGGGGDAGDVGNGGRAEGVPVLVDGVPRLGGDGEVGRIGVSGGITRHGGMGIPEGVRISGERVGRHIGKGLGQANGHLGLSFEFSDDLENT